MIYRIVLAALLLSIPVIANAHGGGLNSEGCHNDRKRGGYHCHRASYTPDTSNYLLNTLSSSRKTNSGTSSLTGTYGSSRYDTTKIYTIQALLEHVGYNVGAVDGKFGNNTKTAIESYQRDNRLIINGTPDDQLILQLSRSLKSLKH